MADAKAPKDAESTRDDVLRRMLKTPPAPRKPPKLKTVGKKDKPSSTAK